MREEDFWNYAHIAFLQGRIDRVLRDDLNGWELLAELASEPLQNVEATVSSSGIFIRIYGIEAACRLEYDIAAALQAWFLAADKHLKDAAFMLRTA